MFRPMSSAVMVTLRFKRIACGASVRWPAACWLHAPRVRPENSSIEERLGIASARFFFYMPDALPVIRPTVSKHRDSVFGTEKRFLILDYAWTCGFLVVQSPQRSSLRRLLPWIFDRFVFGTLDRGWPVGFRIGVPIADLKNKLPRPSPESFRQRFGQNLDMDILAWKISEFIPFFMSNNSVGEKRGQFENGTAL